MGALERAPQALPVALAAAGWVGLVAFVIGSAAAPPLPLGALIVLTGLPSALLGFAAIAALGSSREDATHYCAGPLLPRRSPRESTHAPLRQQVRASTDGA